MPTANINSAPCIATRGRLRAGRALIGLALLLGAGGLLHAAEQAPALKVNADPAFPFSREIEAFAKANEAGPAITDATPRP